MPGITERLNAVPEKPGVYIFRDSHNTILYVGKAKELRNRLRSYFQKSAGLDARKSAMVTNWRPLSWRLT